MRKYFLSILGACCIVFALLYVKYDKQCGVYGLDSYFSNNNLPYGITPKFKTWYPQNFVLFDDDDDFELIGIGFRFYRSSFIIKDFLSYGYNDTSIIVKCTDSLNNIRYLISYITEYKSINGNSEIGFQDLSDTCFQKINHKYKWYNVGNETIENISAKKSGMLILCFLSVVIFFTVLKTATNTVKTKNATNIR